MVFYKLGDHRDYHHGYMVPSTGYLKWFALAQAGDGFTLQFPRRHSPTDLLPPPEYPKLLATFRRYGEWLEKLGVPSVGALNDAMVNDRGREIVLVAEALHERRISEIAAQIAECQRSRPGGAHCRPFIVRQDHLFSAAVDPAARPRALPLSYRTRQFLR